MPEIELSAKLAKLFETHRLHPWYFVLSGGNWGDSLIYAGAEKLARTLGLRWTDLDYRQIGSSPPPRGACIYLHSGAGTADLRYRQCRDPEAIRFSTRGIGLQEMHFFAREMTSAQVLGEMLPPWIRLGVDHDTAFALQGTEVLAIAGVQAMQKACTILSSSQKTTSNLQPLQMEQGSLG